MLNDTAAIANIAVKDLAVAQKFYEGVLGLKRVGGMADEVLLYKSGDSTLNVYRSDFAGTNKATAVSWSVQKDFDKVIKALQDKGVKFEHYDMPGMKLEGDVHVAGNMRTAWFKDPDGNILHVMAN